MRGKKAFYALMVKEQISEEKVFSILSHLAEGMDELILEGEIVVIDEDLVKSIEEIVRESFSPSEFRDEEIRKILQSLFKDIVEKTGKISEKLKQFTKEALFTVLVDKTIMTREKNPIKRLILSQCTGNKGVEEMAEMIRIPLERLMTKFTSYVRKGKIKYKVGYKLAYK